VHRIRHLLNRNTRAQARRNIHAHYDLGNAFYALWLDPTMSYSSTLLPAHATPHAPLTERELADGQVAKYRRVLDELQLRQPGRILEIGCGWGGFAEIALASGHGVDGLTLSTEQLEYARTRLARSSGRWDLRLQDYREEQGQYDAIASIEMFEAVGEAYWPSYFATLKRCLRPGGRACVQTIVIDDALFERYRVGTDFIQQYIFPGGMLPSPSAFRREAQRAGLAVVNELAFGPDYARTLATWRERFHARLDAVRALGFDERFVRIWDFYLAYCEAAFARRSTDVVQFTLVHA
jgi:cyclopropane-fatty-acyl-phospholipid synthase